MSAMLVYCHVQARSAWRSVAGRNLEGAERAQLLAGREMSLREKLTWLEEAASWVDRRDQTDRGKMHEKTKSADSLTRVTAAIIRRPGRVLLARRQSGGHLEGHWEFPGGKIEPDETPEQSLVRELREELGVGAEIGDFIASSRFAYDDREIELLAYEAELEPGEWTLDSHDEVRWVEIRDLRGFDLAPADIPIANRLIQDGLDNQPSATVRNRP